MAKGKTDLNKNFENLKAQMMRRREMAESLEQSNESENNNGTNTNDINVKSDSNTDSSINSNDYSRNENVIQNNKVNINHEVLDNSQTIARENAIELDEEYSNYENNDFNRKQNIEYTAKKTGTVSDININKIVIKKVEKQDQPKRITYYLKPETIKQIDRFSKLSGMGKSEFVQKILDEILNNLEIER